MGPIRDRVGVMVHLQHVGICVVQRPNARDSKNVENVFGFALIGSTECDVVLARSAQGNRGST